MSRPTLEPAQAPERPANPFLSVPCGGCGAVFRPARRNQTHCRPACRRLALGRRRRAEVRLTPAICSCSIRSSNLPAGWATHARRAGFASSPGCATRSTPCGPRTPRSGSRPLAGTHRRSLRALARISGSPRTRWLHKRSRRMFEISRPASRSSSRRSRGRALSPTRKADAPTKREMHSRDPFASRSESEHGARYLKSGRRL